MLVSFVLLLSRLLELVFKLPALASELCLYCGLFLPRRLQATLQLADTLF